MPRDWKTAVDGLTAQERTCLSLLAQGRSYKDVGAMMDRSESMITYYVVCMAKKLGVRKMGQLVRVAVAAGIVPVEFEVTT